VLGFARRELNESKAMNATETERALSTNRAGWDCVAPKFHGGTALPEYGPLAPTEDTLGLLDRKTDLCALELGCGSGHSLRYLAERGAKELWGLDLSPVQVAFAEETLRPFAGRVRLFESAMEVNPGIPSEHFDLVFSIYGLGLTTDLQATMERVASYLKPGGCFIVSGEHPVYGCLEWNGEKYTISESYFTEGPREHASWKGVPIVIHRRTLSTFVRETIHAGLQIEALVETPLNPAAVKDAHADPGRWYSVDRARLMPTTFIIKARKRPGDR
jgi:SAM-dependent methyltransferase